MTKNITAYYADYDEESRLVKDNAHRVEFDTTTHVLDDYIGEEFRVLDVGAGTGRYSFHYAMKGASVFAMDLVEKHVQILRDKLENYQGLKMRADRGNALDLSRFAGEEFDAVLCMGPLYHLGEPEEQMKCLSECKRVLRTGGIVAVAYINKDGHREFGSNPYFNGLDYDYIESALRELGMEIKEHVATDGITPKIGNFINQLDEDGYRAWSTFHLDTCRARASIENTLHALVIAQKL